MGMAASQARFLGLTARKTNTEYEGQQINQQRTALGNQTANYYNQMLGMKVPVPPAIDDFTKTIYTFEDGSLKNTITSLIAKQGGLYTVSYLRQWTDDFAVVSAAPHIVVRNNTTNTTDVTAATAVVTSMNAAVTPILDTTATVTGADSAFAAIKTALETQLATVTNNPNSTASQRATAQQAVRAALEAAQTVLDAAKASGTYTAGTIKTAAILALTNLSADITANGATRFMIGAQELRVLGSMPTVDQIKNDPYLSSLCPDGILPNDKISKLIETERSQILQLNQAYGTSNLGWVVRYVQNTTTGAYEPQFQNMDVLMSPNTIYDSQTAQSQSHIPAYKVGSQNKTEEIKGVNARLEQDATGRIINITLNADQPDAVTYALQTNTVADQMAYDDAMNQYEYNKYQYDQTINEINAKIAIIQAEDRSLELRLKQLDTEQNAIQTEMDAVSKVIEKNVESTFKTFG